MVQLLTVATDNCCICVCGLRSRDHVTEALFNLHWLPVPGRIEFKFKLCVLVYKSFNGIAPSYINDMLQPVTTLQQQVTLRSVKNNDLVVPYAQLRFGECAFSVAAPHLWNSLPVDTRNAATLYTFKKKQDFYVL